MKLVKLKIKHVAGNFILEPTYEKKKKKISIFGFEFEYPIFFKYTNDLEQAVDKLVYITFAKSFRDRILLMHIDEYIEDIEVMYIMKEIWIVRLSSKARNFPDIYVQQVIKEVAENILNHWNKSLENSLVDLNIREVDTLNYEEV